MSFAERARRATLVVAALASLAGVGRAAAQDITDSHLKAARAAVAAISATDQYDLILPTAAQALKTEMINKNPDLQDKIIAIVDDETLKLVPRRGDLEREAATAYARVFTEDQLNAIAAFYNSDAGKKLLSDGPIVTRELIKSAKIWQNGIARDLAQAVGTRLGKEVASAAPPPAAPAAPAAAAPAQGTAQPSSDQPAPLVLPDATTVPGTDAGSAD